MQRQPTVPQTMWGLNQVFEAVQDFREDGPGVLRMGLATPVETQSVRLPFSLCYQFSSADGPGRTVLW